MEFRTIKELYERVYPALYSKVKEIRRLGFRYINETDIWNYLAETTWKNRVNLELYELISDILYVDNYKINDYVTNKLKRINKEEIITDI